MLLAANAARSQIDSIWTGNGDPNNNGNWNAVANWSSSVPNSTNDTAVFPQVTGDGNSGNPTRTIAIDAPIEVKTVQLTSSSAYLNQFTLDADWNVGQFSGLAYGQGVRFPTAVGTHTLTIGTNNLTSAYIPRMASGNGIVRKVGTGTVTLVGDSNFAGTYEIHGGIFHNSWSTYSASSTIDVFDGGTYRIYNGGLTPTIRLRGMGHVNAGALRIHSDSSHQKSSGILKLVEDAAIGVDQAATVFRVPVVIEGPGTLHKVGAGALDFNGTSGYATRLNIAVDAGAFRVSGLITNLGVTVKAGAVMTVTGVLRDSNIVVQDGGTLNAPVYRLSGTDVNVEAGGIWNSTGSPEWFRGPTGNDDGDWSDPNNWGTGYVPTQTNILPQVTDNGNAGGNTRTITVDQPSTTRVVQVGWNSTYLNKIKLDADFTVDRFVGVAYNQTARVPVDINGHTFTVGFENGSMTSPNMCPDVSGTGRFRKIGTGTVTLQGQPFTGTYQVDAGILGTSWATLQSAATVLVNNGGTFQPGGGSGGLNPSLILNGMGHDNNGALRLTGENFSKGTGPITVPSAASLFIQSGRTFTYSGFFRGPGPLTVYGGGTLTLTSTVGATNPVELVVAAGQMNITGVQSNLLITVQENAVVDVTGQFRESHVIVQNGGLFICPAANVSTNVTVEPGGTWDGAPQPGWGPDGDNNNDGVWSDTANWGEGYVPTDVAIFRSVNAEGNSGTTVRTATNDLAHTVVEVRMTQDGNGYINAIHVATNLTVGRFTGPGYSDFDRYRVTIGPGAELAVGKVDDTSYGTDYLPDIRGSGTLRKLGTLAATLRGASTFTGVYDIEEGTLSVNWATLNTSAHAIVRAGAQYAVGGAGIQPLMTLNGFGPSNGGAFRITGNNFTRTSRTTIATAASIHIASGRTLTHNGPLDGPGVLTLAGGGTLTLGGDWTFDLANGIGNGISVVDGTLNTGAATLTIVNTEDVPPGAYMVVDNSWPNGHWSGAFGQINGIPRRWFVEDTGQKMLLVHPHPIGTMLLLR